jgi:membrane protease YdiL (CAAX protease family)
VNAAVACAAGAAAAVPLFAALARTRPSLPTRHALLQGLALLPAACLEEVVWRLGALGAARPLLGTAAALSASSLGFAVAHLRQAGALSVRVHLLTGHVFGGIFLATGALVAAIAAHATYNVLVASAVARGIPP